MNNNPPTTGIKTSTVFSLKPTPKIPGLPAINSGTHILADTSIVRPLERISGLLHQGTKGVLARPTHQPPQSTSSHSRKKIQMTLML